MTTKHTPGPWVFDAEGSIRGADDSPVIFAVVDLVDKSIVPSDVNALLIAAAPDLLAALEDVLPYLDDARIADGARAAIAKAKGLTQ